MFVRRYSKQLFFKVNDVFQNEPENKLVENMRNIVGSAILCGTYIEGM